MVRSQYVKSVRRGVWKVEEASRVCEQLQIWQILSVRKSRIAQKMGQFQLWFAYYDSLFLNGCPSLPKCFYEDHFIPEAQWPSTICPHLSQAFQYLQLFLRDPQTWIQSQCKIQELENMEVLIDELIQFVLMEKSYAYLFWEKDHRRVEASMVHFYSILQLLIRSIIPYPTMTVFECKSANKLCVELPKLQKLINHIMKCVNPIARFLSGPKFSEQFKLVSNFFENVVTFMKKMPFVKRNKLNHVHNLAKYINLTNPLQICNNRKRIQFLSGIRKKSNTVGVKLKQKPGAYYSYLSSPRKKQEKKGQQTFSCVELNRYFKQSSNLIYRQNDKIFKFPTKIIKYAMQEQIKKKQTNVQSLNPLRNKVDSISKNRTLTTNETAVLSRHNTNVERVEVQRKREKARSYVQERGTSRSVNNRPSNNTININNNLNKKGIQGKKRAKFYEEEDQRDSQRMSIRSEKQSTIRKRQLSINTITQIQECKKIQKTEQFFYNSKVNLQINKGLVKKSKWQFVRSWLNERIKMRKIGLILTD